MRVQEVDSLSSSNMNMQEYPSQQGSTGISRDQQGSVVPASETLFFLNVLKMREKYSKIIFVQALNI
jgi:hypothetical protein